MLAKAVWIDEARRGRHGVGSDMVERVAPWAWPRLKEALAASWLWNVGLAVKAGPWSMVLGCLRLRLEHCGRTRVRIER